MTKKIFEKSQKCKQIIRLNTKHPDGDSYVGVVLGFSKSVVILHEVKDFEFVGVNTIARKFIQGFRDSSFEETQDKILKHNKQIAKLSRKRWIADVVNIKSALEKCSKRKIWPIVEIVKNNESWVYIGPITHVGKRKFSIYCYDANGIWECDYSIRGRSQLLLKVVDKGSLYNKRL